MKIGVLGAGNTGLAMAAELQCRGYDVVAYSRNKQKVDYIKERGVQLDTALQADERIRVTDEIGEAVVGRDILFVMTTSAGHKPMAERIRPHLGNDQLIVIFCGNWGAYEFQQILWREAAEKNITIAETNTNLFIALAPDISNPGVIRVKQMKQSIAMAGIRRWAGGLRMAQALYPQIRGAESVLSTTLDNTNPIIHVVTTLFNLPRVEMGEEFLFYKQGASKSLLGLVSRADRERVEICRALGVQCSPMLDTINSYWPDKHDNLYDAIHNNPSYQTAMGPRHLGHRYIEEDLPYGVIPLCRLALLLCIPAPCLNLLADTASTLLGRDFRKEGPLISSIDDLQGLKGAP